MEALARCKKELGVRTILGVSNISFGLPCRPYLNTTFLTMAMYAGLDLAIMNPSSEEMMAAVYSYNVLTNRDKQSMAYIARYADKVPCQRRVGSRPGRPRRLRRQTPRRRRMQLTAARLPR